MLQKAQPEYSVMNCWHTQDLKWFNCLAILADVKIKWSFEGAPKGITNDMIFYK